MTATPPRDHQIWNPSRGISFSPGPAPPILAAQTPRMNVELPLRVDRQHARSLQSAAASATSPIARAERNETLEGVASAQPAAVEDAPAAPKSDDPLNEAVEPKEGKTTPEKKASDEPPPACFEYQIDEGLFRAAKSAAPGSPESFWSYTQYGRRDEDGSLDRVKVHYCRSRQKMEEVCKKYFMEEKLLGFDLEWVPNSSKRDGVKNNVSLIQLASPSRIALFHVALFANTDNLAAPSFKTIMENSDVTKVGVAIKGDATRLRNFLYVDSKGLMELSHLYKLVTYSSNRQYKSINKTLVSLAAQVEEYLRLPLFKGQGVRSSDWSRPLAMDQINYSASDAYASLHLFATLEHHRKQLDPCPPTPHHAELNIPIRLADGVDLADADDPPDVDVAAISEDRPTPSEQYLASVRGTVTIEDQDTITPDSPDGGVQGASPPPPQMHVPPTPPAEHSPDDSRLEIVADMVASYRKQHPHSRATGPHLKAYYLWHRYDLAPQFIRKMMRNPPLAFQTVVYYIFWAVQSDNLPVDEDRLKELTQLVPPQMLWTRWPVIAKKVLASKDSALELDYWDKPPSVNPTQKQKFPRR